MRFKTMLIAVLFVLLTAGLALLGPAQSTLATPDKGANCLECHSAMPPTNANVKTAQPSAEAPVTQPAQPATKPATKMQPTITLPVVGDVRNLIAKNVTVTTSALNVRASGSLQAHIINAVSKNTILSVLAEQSGWLQVEYKGGTGWVYGYYVTLADEQLTESTPTAPATEARPSLVNIPSINEQAKTSRLGSMHWNMFKENVSNPEDPEQNNCISCHSAVKMVDDPEAQLTDFLQKGQTYATGEVENPVTGETEFNYSTATEDGKYLSNDFEGITCRVCHTMDKNGVTLSKPDNTCTQCHGRVFNWETGSGHHVTNDFYLGHGETYNDPSVHYTLGMQCQDCHTMNAIKHDYEPAKPEDIARNAKCQSCHQSAVALENIIKSTQTTVKDSLNKINDRLAAAQKLIDDKKMIDTENLVVEAKARVNFITSDLSNGVHNPQFAGKLINEANNYLDQFNGLSEASSTPAVDLGNLTVYSQAQSSKLGNQHWDKLETGISYADDPSQNNCISCHSAVKIVDDPAATIPDFLKKGETFATGEVENPITGITEFQFSTVTEDGKYLQNYKEGITCRVCHTVNQNQPGHIDLRRSDEQTCGLCHGRTYNWNTGSGHHVELAFFKGQGSSEKGIPDTPSPKAQMGFACQDCHFMDNTKHDFEPATPEQIAANSNCSSCHTAASTASMIKGIQEEVQTGIDKLKPRLEIAKAYVDKNPTNDAAKETYTQAKAGITFIESDYSEGVHNPTFARYLLTRSDKLLTDLEAKYK